MIPTTSPAGIAVAGDSRLRTADRIFRGALAFNAALTLFWLVDVSDRQPFFFRDYTVNLATVGRILSGVLFFYVIWGVIWWAIKTALLRWFVGFTKEERRDAFSSRMDRPYDVGALVQRYSERRIRIADMIGRRGRFITLAPPGFYYLYSQIAAAAEPDFATAFLERQPVRRRRRQLDLPRRSIASATCSARSSTGRSRG